MLVKKPVAEPKTRMNVLIEIIEALRQALAPHVFGRSIEMVMHGEELALDEIGLDRPAQADRHVGLAHGEIELAVVKQQGRP